VRPRRHMRGHQEKCQCRRSERERGTDGPRERSKEDRRVVYIRLTSRGRKLAEEIPVEPMEIFRGALESLTPAETRELVKILGKVARRVRQTVRRETAESVETEK